MLKDSNMAKQYWAEAFKTVTYVRNIIKIEGINNVMSPTMDQKPDLDFMCVFGSNCFAHVPKEKRNKSDNTATKCNFLGYSENQKAYRVMYISNGNVSNSRSATFMESNGYEKDTMKISKYEDMRKKI
jgi:hypothetical protein